MREALRAQGTTPEDLPASTMRVRSASLLAYSQVLSECDAADIHLDVDGCDLCSHGAKNRCFLSLWRFLGRASAKGG